MTPKQLVIHSLQELPDDSTPEDFKERINFTAGIQLAVRELDEGKGIPHEEIEKEFTQWLSD